jgi:hypothetical protein
VNLSKNLQKSSGNRSRSQKEAVEAQLRDAPAGECYYIWFFAVFGGMDHAIGEWPWESPGGTAEISRGQDRPAVVAPGPVRARFAS